MEYNNKKYNNNSLFIHYHNNKYSVQFSKQRDSWIWKQNDWMNQYYPDSELLEEANRILQNFRKL